MFRKTAKAARRYEHSYLKAVFVLNSTLNGAKPCPVRHLLNGTRLVRHRCRADPSNRCVIV
jgi:hypothetical protein